MITNITNLTLHSDLLIDQQVACIVGQEHSTPKQRHTQITKDVQPWSIHMSGTDPECEQPTGGLFLMQQMAVPPLTPKPMSPQLRQINGQGRVQLYAMHLGANTTILIYNIYGWTNANNRLQAAARTNSMIHTILDDMARQPMGPKFVIGRPEWGHSNLPRP